MINDPIAVFWVTLWASLGSYGLYLLVSENKGFAASVFVYGKSLKELERRQPLANKRKVNKETDIRQGLFWKLFLLPKRYFTHFYLIALLVVFVPCFVSVLIYYIPQASGRLNGYIRTSKSLLKTYDIKVEVYESKATVTALIFTLILMIIQTARRLYECLFISVYSSQSKINLIHYAFGHLFYIFMGFSTVCPILMSETTSKYNLLDLLDNLITKPRAIGFILFIYASHYQQKCHKLLANLRKDKAGQVITEQHYVPAGSLFEYVSCPHFLIEVILYFLILCVQEFKIFYWNLIFLLVVTTQTINAITEHRWYKREYKDFPKERKAIYPWLL